MKRERALGRVGVGGLVLFLLGLSPVRCSVALFGLLELRLFAVYHTGNRLGAACRMQYDD